MCWGDGEVSNDVANLYFTKQDENHAAMKEAWEKAES